MNELRTSMVFGSGMFAITLVFLSLTKPDTVMKITTKTRVINWYRVILISLMFGLATAGCTFLILKKNIVEQNLKPSTSPETGFLLDQ